MEFKTTRSIRKNFEESTGKDSDTLVQLVCATMLISAGLMNIDDPVCASKDYYDKLEHRAGRGGCPACPLVDKCVACKMCE